MDRIDHDGLRHGGLADTETPVSLGYDRIRFTAPVFLGDTITVTYTITELHPVPATSEARSRRATSRARPSQSPSTSRSGSEELMCHLDLITAAAWPASRRYQATP